ncbi:hypothetical protein [Streptomyces sp. NPDC001744]|uniref:hypothetical protein n=1 Tax=Streptomyces sp. NPDC001744 TaxID=3364606 RepID=UPI003682A9C7
MTRLLRGAARGTGTEEKAETAETVRRTEPVPDTAGAAPGAEAVTDPDERPGDRTENTEGKAEKPEKALETKKAPETKKPEKPEKPEKAEKAEETEEAEEEPPEDEGGCRSTSPWRRIALPAAVVALLLGGSAFFYGAHQLRSTPSARNHALTDVAATTRVGGDVGEGLARIFSYAPSSADAAERSARTVLTGRAARQYGDLFAQVRANLVKQRVTLTTQAVRVGVIELDGDDARLLVFLDQTSRRDKAPATTAAAQLTVTAKFRGDRWLIADIKAR